MVACCDAAEIAVAPGEIAVVGDAWYGLEEPTGDMAAKDARRRRSFWFASRCALKSPSYPLVNPPQGEYGVLYFDASLL